jgi:hypothetical protein
MPPKKYVGPRSTAAAPPARRRGRVEKERPKGMTNAEWAFDLQRRQVENASRRQRELRAKKKRASEAMAAEVAMAQRAVHMAGMSTFPPQVQPRRVGKPSQCLVAVAVFGNNPGWADVPGQARYAPAFSLLAVHAARRARHLQPQ